MSDIELIINKHNKELHDFKEALKRNEIELPFANKIVELPNTLIRRLFGIDNLVLRDSLKLMNYINTMLIYENGMYVVRSIDISAEAIREASNSVKVASGRSDIIDDEVRYIYKLSTERCDSNTHQWPITLEELEQVISFVDSFNDIPKPHATNAASDINNYLRDLYEKTI